ncbi:MAG TPA: hypothetical protein VMB25_02255 [Bryobacteraceae bacterium]|nr:hypothetical protein [Bryobacteraceae bacterium]
MGFLLGISAGVILGYYFRPPDVDRPRNQTQRPDSGDAAAGAAGPRRVGDRSPAGGEVTRISSAS